MAQPDYSAATQNWQGGPPTLDQWQQAAQQSALAPTVDNYDAALAEQAMSMPQDGAPPAAPIDFGDAQAAFDAQLAEAQATQAGAPPAAAVEPMQPLSQAPAARRGGGQSFLGGLAREVGQEAADSKTALDQATGERDKGFADQQAAIDAAQKAADADAKARVKIGQAYDADVSLQERAARDELDAHQSALARIDQERRALQEDASRFEIKDRRNIAQRVAGAIAVAMNGMGNALIARGGGQAGPNIALEIVQRNIDRDIAAQEKMLQNKQLAVAAKDTELGRAIQRYGMTREAQQAARAMLSEKYARGLEIQAAQTSSEQSKARALALSGQLRAAQAEKTVAFEQQRYGQLTAEHRRLRAADYQAQQQAAAAKANAAARAEQEREAAFDRALERRRRVVELKLKEKELEGGGEVNAAQQKTRQLLQGVKPAADAIAARLRKGESGSTEQSSWRGDWMTDDAKIEYNRDIMQVARMILRDESGANLPDDEVANKLEKEYGVFSSDAFMRKRGMERLLDEYYGRQGLTRPGAPAGAEDLGGGKRTFE